MEYNERCVELGSCSPGYEFGNLQLGCRCGCTLVSGRCRVSVLGIGLEAGGKERDMEASLGCGPTVWAKVVMGGNQSLGIFVVG